MTSTSKMISSLTKRMSPTNVVSQRTKSSENKRESDAELLRRMFDSNAYSTDTKGNGVSRSGEKKGMTYLGHYCFAGVGDSGIGSVDFHKVTPRFVIDSTADYESERSMLLLNNVNAKDVSVDELKDFIQKSSLALRPYEKTKFICGDFAARLHNKAEASGIRCGYVVITGVNGDAHAFNVFCGINKNGTRSVVFADMTDKKQPFVSYAEFKRVDSKRIIRMHILV
jgi:hypothetical protein